MLKSTLTKKESANGNEYTVSVPRELVTARRALKLLLSLKPREAVYDVAMYDKLTDELMGIVFNELTKGIHKLGEGPKRRSRRNAGRSL